MNLFEDFCYIFVIYLLVNVFVICEVNGFNF